MVGRGAAAVAVDGGGGVVIRRRRDLVGMDTHSTTPTSQQRKRKLRRSCLYLYRVFIEVDPYKSLFLPRKEMHPGVFLSWARSPTLLKTSHRQGNKTFSCIMVTYSSIACSKRVSIWLPFKGHKIPSALPLSEFDSCNRQPHSWCSFFFLAKVVLILQIGQ